MALPFKLDKTHLFMISNELLHKSNKNKSMQQACVCVCVRVRKGQLVVITDSIWSITTERSIEICPFIMCSLIIPNPQRGINEEEGAVTSSL